MAKYPIIYDGDWVKIPKRFIRIACCDCGLIHDIKVRIRKGKIEFQPHRNNRATGQRRRHLTRNPKPATR